MEALEAIERRHAMLPQDATATARRSLPVASSSSSSSSSEEDTDSGPHVRRSAKRQRLSSPHALQPSNTLVAPSVTLSAVESAKSALEDFVGTYSMFHDGGEDGEHRGGIAAVLLPMLPTLTWIEAHIYALDDANEDSLCVTGPESDGQPPRPPDADPFGPLRSLLAPRGWLTAGVEAELSAGARFWQLERKICQELRRCKLSFSSRGVRLLPDISREDVDEASQLKSFDYRLMNHLVYAMRRAEPDRRCLEFLRTTELLVELGDDITDYYADVEANSFNVYRCYCAMHGTMEHGACALRERIRGAEAACAARRGLLPDEIARRWQQHGSAVGRHGSKASGGEGGDVWVLPPPVDEGWAEPAASEPRPPSLAPNALEPATNGGMGSR